MNKILAIALLGFCVFVGPFLASKSFETLEANEYMVVQSMTGNLTAHFTPGPKWQGFGTVTKYPMRNNLSFLRADPETKRDLSIGVQFNDGGHCTVEGSLSYELPASERELIEIHSRFRNVEALENDLLKRLLVKSIYMTGPLLSSTDSYAARRAEFLGWIEDQYTKGLYRTVSRDERQVDPISGISKTVKVVEIQQDPKTSLPLRVEASPIESLGIKVFNLTIEGMEYDPKVKEQIAQQQAAFMAVQTAIAETKTAEQKKLTVVAKGEADSAEAEWQQKVLAAKAEAEAEQMKNIAITKANQEKEVALLKASQELESAQLAAQAAEQLKLAEILKGEGLAKARSLVLAADGSLETKLAAWTKVNEAYAQALGNYQGAWTPSVIMGSSGSTTSGATGGVSAAQELMSMLMVKTAKDLAIDVQIPNKGGDLPEITKPAPSNYKFTPKAINTYNSGDSPTIPKVNIPLQAPVTTAP